MRVRSLIMPLNTDRHLRLNLRSAFLLAIVFCLAEHAFASSPANEQKSPEGAAGISSSLAAIAGHGMVGNHAYEYLQELSDEVGGRLTGSPQDEAAAMWASSKMKAMGLQNVHLEKWPLYRKWKRISASAEIITPIRRSLTVDSMGWVGSTPAGGTEGDVAIANTYQLEREVTEHGSEWAGKIVLLTRKGEAPANLDPLVRFGALGKFIKAAEAAHVAALILSQGDWEAAGMRLTHTSILGFGAYFDLPVISMIPEDRSQLERFIAAGRHVHLKLNVQNESRPEPGVSSNVVGEIPGTDHPEQVIVIGGHLDSWDLAQGSTDDGEGVAVTLGAAEAILASGQRPKRTLRFVLFTGEEQGLLGSFAYVKAHSEELQNYVAALVLDNGQGPVVKLNLGGRKELIPLFQDFGASVIAFGKIEVNDKINFDTDCGPFTMAGLPGINLEQDSPQSRFPHHSRADTFDKIVPDVLLRNTTLAALLGFWIADTSEITPTLWTSQKMEQMLIDEKQDEGLKAMGLWTFPTRNKSDER